MVENKEKSKQAKIKNNGKYVKIISRINNDVEITIWAKFGGPKVLY